MLAFLVLNPVLRLLASSFTPARGGGWTLANYVFAVSRPRYIQAFWTSMELGAAVTAICLVLAVPLAWMVSRTDMPAKGTIRMLVLASFVMPPYLGAIGWILLAGPNAGWLNIAWRAVTGAADPLFNIYSFGGLAFVIALYTFPFLFVFVSGALDVVSSEMEDAANILGAGTWRTARRVTLAAGAAGAAGGRHHHLPRDHQPGRHPGADRAAGSDQRRHHAADAVLQPADPRRGRRRLHHAAAAA